MPKDFESFFSLIKTRKLSFWGEFGQISSSKRSLALCTTVVQLGIIRLKGQQFKFETTEFVDIGISSFQNT